MTLIELIVVVSIIALLATAAIPIARFQVKRQKERELRRDLWMLREAIDHYKDKKVRFLREIPTDPMTKSNEWKLRSMQDDADTSSWGGQNVFDVHSKSDGTALDGTRYATW